MTGDGDRFEVRLGRMRSPSGARKVEGFFRKVSKGARKLGRGGGRGRSQRSAARTQSRTTTAGSRAPAEACAARSLRCILGIFCKKKH